MTQKSVNMTLIQRKVLIPSLIILLLLYGAARGEGFDLHSFLLYRKINYSSSSIDIDGRTFTLETRLNRDFMPICPPDGRPLCAVVKIIPNDTLPFPSNLDVISIWVVDGFKVWETELTKLETPYGSNVLVKMAGGGPKSNS